MKYKLETGDWPARGSGSPSDRELLGMIAADREQTSKPTSADTTNLTPMQKAAAKALGDCWATHADTPGPNPECCIPAAVAAFADQAAIERGRQIAESMMDHAEARHRHERGQPHRRDQCEDCAREAVADAARRPHFLEAAASLHEIAAHRLAKSTDALETARAEGIDQAATLLERAMQDDEGATE